MREREREEEEEEEEEEENTPESGWDKANLNHKPT